MRACLLLALIAIAVAAVSCGDGSPTASHPAHAKVTLAERKAIFNDGMRTAGSTASTHVRSSRTRSVTFPLIRRRTALCFKTSSDTRGVCR